MSTIWDSLGEHIKTWTSTAAEKAGHFTRVAANKAEELGKLGRLKMEIYQLQRERGRLHAELGMLAYKALEEYQEAVLKDLPGVEDLRLRVASLGQKIASKENELAKASDLENAAQSKTAAEPKPAAGSKPAGRRATTRPKKASASAKAKATTVRKRATSAKKSSARRTAKKADAAKN